MAGKTKWRETGEQAKILAKQLGHNIEPFTGRRETPGVRTASCLQCWGCCWISSDGKAGGRILKYRCGTKQARGVL